MTAWEKRIIDAFVERYPASAAAAISGAAGSAQAAAPAGPAGGESPAGEPRPLRLRLDRIFPGFEGASPDDRESFLEAAEALEQRGLLSLIWVRHRKGEVPAALVCGKADLLFELAGKPSPRIVAEDVRKLARGLALAAQGYHQAMGTRAHKTGETEIALFSFIAENFTPQDAALGIDVIAVTDLAHLTGFFSGIGAAIQGPDKIQGLTLRALSVALYGDSKRLEALISLLSPLLSRARRMGAAVPDFAFLDRSYPETFIAGKIILHFKKTPDPGLPPSGMGEGEPPRLPENTTPPLVNAAGSILGFPLGTILKLGAVTPLEGKTASVLMIENKETFFVLAESLPGYTCFLYIGGHPNRAVQALVSLLAQSGFTFFHAGDLDPDGILILQELGEIAGKTIQPLRMDAATFDRYRNCGKKLEPTMLRRLGLITGETRSLPGMEELIQRIEETGLGVEQEIIDYR
ncbi:DUF2220 family protein [Treponema sp. TIM-1]|uniref:Wadjet anti-phage system protein JetD domain-containing protein n=1 Tax=Treponema sp. TIM-1 TaxID=2898417 RepID=UPI00397FA474